ncbi:MAG: hypothetical protein COT81_02985 [Candidatus Buchananbacteria bacterium CG10_big_fil_rev_8_21_14_0_10_42_9]|uniref:NodB homology domain-containing protein n=1 Tax=Candidatus Buchananbacteria bacterium CG10_big_fil_rev_8_21_14_0_10_42_9 TaxID=1974526 RepID=A0A2H0W1D8_9BACT|nr:MAG: hypothetical protein COT81_02985 [Candidatus Buchananbacteria bacterium CG10_big_fil_rev_8_21_14_0_10_42_9]
MPKPIIYIAAIPLVVVVILAVAIFFTLKPKPVVAPGPVEEIEQDEEPKPSENLEARVPIIIYHHVREAKPTDSESDKQFIISPADFESQMKYLADNNFTTISFKNLVDYFSGQFELPNKPVIISFDDGTISQYQNAFPLLKKHNLTATFFIFTNPISRSENYMTWEQLKEMADAGMEIGSHGHYHLYFDRINEGELAKELSGSKEILEKQLGKQVYAVAYPFGTFDEKVVESLKEAGYLAARGIANGVDHTAEDLYDLNAYFVTSNFSRFVNIVNQKN